MTLGTADPGYHGAVDPMTDTNEYSVRVENGSTGWSVHIIDPGGTPVFTRACADEVEARTFASTVRQHIDWLSPSKFQEYYKLPEPA
jgi:hypothetical protein